jgi:hypothetical protein
LEKSAEAILKVENYQYRNILFIQSFCHKMNYLQRTIRPELMNHTLIPYYDTLKQKIFCSIAEIEINIIDEMKWK